MAISGQPGLFKFISQARNGIIVESFSDQKRTFVSSSTKVSTLEDVAIYTDKEEVPLKDVFQNIRAMGDETQVPDTKSTPVELKAFMEIALPEYDRSRVYISDIKKLVSWYHILKENDLLNVEEEKELKEGEEEPNADKEVKTEPEAEQKPDKE